MKIEIDSHDMISLKPESEADLALVRLWANRKPYVGSVGYDGPHFEVQKIFIRFEEEKSNQPHNPHEKDCC